MMMGCRTGVGRYVPLRSSWQILSKKFVTPIRSSTAYRVTPSTPAVLDPLLARMCCQAVQGVRRSYTRLKTSFPNELLVVLLAQYCPYQPQSRLSIEENANHTDAALDLLVEPPERAGRVNLPAMLYWEGHVGKETLSCAA